MENCIFCKIIRGEIPCYKVYESRDVLAFLDINPINRGHVLVIPKEHYKDVFEIKEDLLVEVVKVSKMIATRLKDFYLADGVDIFQANGEAGEQTVFHYHMHVIPRSKDDDIDFSKMMMGVVKKLNENEFEEIKKALEFI
ncbi:MAG: HIT family protein [Minisyncoccus archaeiphilus]|jgi:histidine triad (HIT) family protein|uniref:HIT family protein n=1 Tax=Minisyncoccus archaeiphilus TaxID=3238481 RepID=UPI0009D1B3B3|nr:MAG: HIT-like protein [Parcubacteria group bacterium ADurb.Bin216]GMX59895.1 MAG: HIT family protein [Candidatus Parcubacteria bacterium]